MQNRCRIFRRAQQNLNETSDWTLASSLFGVKTYYRREDDGSLSLKLEGELKDCPLFEQVCVLKEIDLHYRWAPFCASSMTIADLDKLDTIGWFVIGLPNFGLSRDGVFRAIGCDNILEDGSILLAGQGVQDIPEGAPPAEDTYLCEDPILDKLDIPPVPTRRGAGRMTLRVVQAVIHVTSPTSARTRLVANLDPNMTFLPQPLLEFVMKNLAGVLLAKLQAAAKRIPKHPVANEHARRMRDEEDFYKHWLMPKFQAVCDARGWTMPAVTAFELTEEQLHKDNLLAEKRAASKKNQYRRAVSFDVPIVDDDEMSLRRQHSAPQHFEEDDHLDNGNSAAANNINSNNPLINDDGVSELTTKSTRSLPFNIAQTLKVREERKKRRKEEAIALQRMAAAERLRPKEFSVDQQKRLEELRRLKEARTGRSRLDSDRSDASAATEDPRIRSEPVPGTVRAKPNLRHADTAPAYSNGSPVNTRIRSSMSEQVTDRLYRQGPFTRLFVLLCLTFIMFVLLHPRLLWTVLRPDFVEWWDSKKTHDTATSVMTWVKGGIMIGYILLCTAAHFCLCDIALVYAFDSLELGSKAGRKLRKFYSRKVRLGVASFSLTIAGLCVGRSLFKAMLRYACWAAAGFVQTLGPYIPDFVGSTMTIAWMPFRYMFNAIGAFLAYITQLNTFTEALGCVVERGWSVLALVSIFVQGFWNDSIAIVNGEIEVAPWYVESLALAKYLFSYSSVFLVTVLVLFNVSAKKSAASRISTALSDPDDMSTLGSSLDSKTRGRLPDIPEHSSSSPKTQGKLHRRKTSIN